MSLHSSMSMMIITDHNDDEDDDEDDEGLICSVAFCPQWS